MKMVEGERKKEVPARRKKERNPACWKTDHHMITEYFTEKRRKKKEKARKLEENWKLLRECIQYLE